MKLFFAAVIALVLIATNAIAKPQTDTDWNWSGDSSCGHPRSDSVQWLTEGDRRFVRFQLRDGDIGKCPTDNDPAHSAKYGKPYSERTEWAGHAFYDDGRLYHISFDVRFVQGFDQDQLTATFFQIKDCPTSRVPVMAKLGGWHKSTGGRAKMGFSLGTQSDNPQYYSQFLNNDPVDNEWHHIDAYYQTGERHSLSVELDGVSILPKTEFANVFDCGRPRFHIGIYRSGDENGNSHSIVDYDRILIEPIASIPPSASVEEAYSPFKGLFRPSGAANGEWNCSEDYIGQEGGALAILDGYFEGVENRCKLAKPKLLESGGTQFDAECSAEGTEYLDDLVLFKTNNGIKFIRNGYTVYWKRCPAPQKTSTGAPSIAEPSNGKWTFGGRQGVYESGTSDRDGNSVTFVCNDIGQNGGLYIELAGKPIVGGSVEIDIDGRRFDMSAWTDDGKINTECSACQSTYTALWNASAAGNTMTITSRDGQSAIFSLRGSRAALGDTACAPDDGF